MIKLLSNRSFAPTPAGMKENGKRRRRGDKRRENRPRPRNGGEGSEIGSSRGVPAVVRIGMVVQPGKSSFLSSLSKVVHRRFIFGYLLFGYSVGFAFLQLFVLLQLYICFLSSFTFCVHFWPF